MNQLELFPMTIKPQWEHGQQHPRFIIQWGTNGLISLSYDEMDELKKLVNGIRTDSPPEEGDKLGIHGEVDYDFIVAWDNEFMPGGHDRKSYFQDDDED